MSVEMQSRCPQSGLDDYTLESMPGLQQLSVVPGVSLNMLNTVLENDLRASTELVGQSVEFSFVLSGNAQVISRNGANSRVIDIRSNVSFSHYMPDSHSQFSIKNDEPVRMLGIMMDLSILESLFDEGDRKIIKTIMSKPDRLLNQSAPLTSVQKMIVNQMLSCSFSSAGKKLYMQSKALELLAYQVEHFSELLTAGKAIGASMSLNSDEIDRIHYARECLRNNMADPPGLQELSAQCGLNVNKLKKGFRAVFDQTAFGCLHEDRMQRAHQLITERRLNVSEVAWEIGYTNVGHFSAAFKKRFGIKPKALQLEIGRRFYEVSSCQ